MAHIICKLLRRYEKQCRHQVKAISSQNAYRSAQNTKKMTKRITQTMWFPNIKIYDIHKEETMENGK